jgi:hypothetical protein
MFTPMTTLCICASLLVVLLAVAVRSSIHASVLNRQLELNTREPEEEESQPTMIRAARGVQRYHANALLRYRAEQAGRMAMMGWMAFAILGLVSMALFCSIVA